MQPTPCVSNGSPGVCQQFLREFDWHAAFVSGVVDCRPRHFHALFPQQQRISPDLNRFRFPCFSFPFAGTAGRAFLVVHDLRSVRPAFDQIHDPDKTQRLALQAQTAQLCAFGEILSQGLRLFFVKARWRIHVAVRMDPATVSALS